MSTSPKTCEVSEEIFLADIYSWEKQNVGRDTFKCSLIS